jgi:anti-sigma B factor antagonist
MSDEAVERLLSLDIDRAAFLAGDIVLVRCRGKLVAGVTAILYTEVSQLIPNTKRIVLDLSDLTYIDSMGLGTVVRLYVSARAAGCDVKLINLGTRIRHLLSISNLLSVFSANEESDVPMH